MLVNFTNETITDSVRVQFGLTSQISKYAEYSELHTEEQLRWLYKDRNTYLYTSDMADDVTGFILYEKRTHCIRVLDICGIHAEALHIKVRTEAKKARISLLDMYVPEDALDTVKTLTQLGWCIEECSVEMPWFLDTQLCYCLTFDLS